MGQSGWNRLYQKVLRLFCLEGDRIQLALTDDPEHHSGT